MSQCPLAAHITPTILPAYATVPSESQCPLAAHITPTEHEIAGVVAVMVAVPSGSTHNSYVLALMGMDALTKVAVPSGSTHNSYPYLKHKH